MWSFKRKNSRSVEVKPAAISLIQDIECVEVSHWTNRGVMGATARFYSHTTTGEIDLAVTLGGAAVLDALGVTPGHYTARIMLWPKT